MSKLFWGGVGGERAVGKKWPTRLTATIKTCTFMMLWNKGEILLTIFRLPSILCLRKPPVMAHQTGGDNNFCLKDGASFCYVLRLRSAHLGIFGFLKEFAP